MPLRQIGVASFLKEIFYIRKLKEEDYSMINCFHLLQLVSSFGKNFLQKHHTLLCPHEGKTELSTYPQNYVYVSYVWSYYSNQDPDASSVTEVCVLV